MITPALVATRGYFNSPFAVARQGYLYLATQEQTTPTPRPPSVSGGAGGSGYGAPDPIIGYDRHNWEEFRGQIDPETLLTDADRENDELLTIFIAMVISGAFE